MKNWKRFTFMAMAILTIFAIGLTVAACDNGGGGGGGGAGGGATTPLASNASYTATVEKLDAIIAYCDNNPGATNASIKALAEAKKEQISHLQEYWSSAGSGHITIINDQMIAALEGGGNGDGDGNGDGNGGGSKPAALASNASQSATIDKLDEIIDYCNDNPGSANNAVKGTAEGLKTAISGLHSASWSGMGSTYVTQINDQMIANLQ